MNGLNVDGFAPLHIATDENFIEVLDLLVDPSNKQLNINIANSSGQTALHIAVR
jgi:ankyrin repeat protein